MKLTKKHTETGRSIFETLLVIVLICLLTFFGIMVYRGAVDRYKADRYYEQIMVEAASRKNRGTQRTTKGIADTTWVPMDKDFMREDNCPHDAFSIRIKDVDENVCRLLMEKKWKKPLEPIYFYHANSWTDLCSGEPATITTDGFYMTSADDCEDGTFAVTFALNDKADGIQPCDDNGDCSGCQKCSSQKICLAKESGESGACGAGQKCTKNGCEDDITCNPETEYILDGQCETCPDAPACPAFAECCTLTGPVDVCGRPTPVVGFRDWDDNCHSCDESDEISVQDESGCNKCPDREYYNGTCYPTKCRGFRNMNGDCYDCDNPNAMTLVYESECNKCPDREYYDHKCYHKCDDFRDVKGVCYDCDNPDTIYDVDDTCNKCPDREYYNGACYPTKCRGFRNMNGDCYDCDNPDTIYDVDDTQCNKCPDREYYNAMCYPTKCEGFRDYDGICHDCDDEGSYYADSCGNCTKRSMIEEQCVYQKNACNEPCNACEECVCDTSGCGDEECEATGGICQCEFDYNRYSWNSSDYNGVCCEDEDYSCICESYSNQEANQEGTDTYTYITVPSECCSGNSPGACSQCYWDGNNFVWDGCEYNGACYSSDSPVCLCQDMGVEDVEQCACDMHPEVGSFHYDFCCTGEKPEFCANFCVWNGTNYEWKNAYAYWECNGTCYARQLYQNQKRPDLLSCSCPEGSSVSDSDSPPQNRMLTNVSGCYCNPETPYWDDTNELCSEPPICYKNMINAGFSECATSNATQCFTISGNTITYRGRMEPAGNLNLSNCNLITGSLYNLAGTLQVANITASGYGLEDSIHNTRTISVTGNITANSSPRYAIFNSGTISCNGSITATSSEGGIWMTGGQISAGTITATASDSGSGIDITAGELTANGNIVATSSGRGFYGLLVHGSNAEVISYGKITGQGWGGISVSDGTLKAKEGILGTGDLGSGVAVGATVYYGSGSTSFGSGTIVSCGEVHGINAGGSGYGVLVVPSAHLYSSGLISGQCTDDSPGSYGEYKGLYITAGGNNEGTSCGSDYVTNVGCNLSSDYYGRGLINNGTLGYTYNCRDYGAGYCSCNKQDFCSYNYTPSWCQTNN